MSSLPSIELLGMNISASVYMTKASNGGYQSNFAVYDTNWNKASTVVVLGWKVMSQYYSVFQASHDQGISNVTLYARHDDISQADNRPELTGNNSTIKNGTSEAANTTQPKERTNPNLAEDNTGEPKINEVSIEERR